MNLPRRQKQLYDLLLGRGDVLIEDIYASMFSVPPPIDTMQMQQRWLGPYVAALNKKLANDGLRVEPGALKNTYRLVASL